MNGEIIKQVTGVIFTVVVKKSGTTNGRNWMIYEVVIGGEPYSTFDAGYKELIGQQGTFNYTEKQNTSGDGRVFTNKTLQAVSKPEAPPQPQAPQPGVQPGYQPKMVSVSEAVVNTLVANQQKIMKALKIDDIPVVNEPPPAGPDGYPPGY